MLVSRMETCVLEAIEHGFMKRSEDYQSGELEQYQKEFIKAYDALLVATPQESHFYLKEMASISAAEADVFLQCL